MFSPSLNESNAIRQLLFRRTVTDLAGLGDMGHWTADAVVADLDRALTQIRHVTVCTGNSTARMNTLVPDLELGMLRLQHLRLREPVRPVAEALALSGLVVVL